MTLHELLEQGAVAAAKSLLGWQFFVREDDGSLTGGEIIETEAYHQADAASHSYKGKTPRTEVMFGPAGHMYVYFTYGMHWCMNIVSGQEGTGEAVLIRTITPTSNLDIIKKRRGNKPESELTNGPAKVCQALAVTGQDNGARLNASRFVLRPPKRRPGKITATERIGISRDTHRLWRFVLEAE